MHNTKALESKSRQGVVLKLLQIFSLIGPPMILHTDNGREFSNVAGQSAEAQNVGEEVYGMLFFFEHTHTLSLSLSPSLSPSLALPLSLSPSEHMLSGLVWTAPVGRMGLVL